MEDHISEALSLEDLAAEAHLSASQFHNLFKSQTGTTPFKFFETLKMNKAYQTIMEGEAQVGELALKLGYNDYETFSRGFKKHFEIAPDDLRAISAKIKAKTGGYAKVVVKVVDDPDSIDPEQIMEELRIEFGLTKSQMKQAVPFMIRPKTEETTDPDQLIKNKFELVPQDRIWKSILKKNNR